MVVATQEEEEGHRTSSGSRDAHPGAEESPFGSISATLGWETFRLVHSTWLTAIELPPRDKTKWDMQVRLWRHQHWQYFCMIMPQSSLGQFMVNDGYDRAD